MSQGSIHFLRLNRLKMTRDGTPPTSIVVSATFDVREFLIKVDWGERKGSVGIGKQGCDFPGIEIADGDSRVADPSRSENIYWSIGIAGPTASRAVPPRPGLIPRCRG